MCDYTLSNLWHGNKDCVTDEENPTGFTLRERWRQMEKYDLAMKSFSMALHTVNPALHGHVTDFWLYWLDDTFLKSLLHLFQTLLIFFCFFVKCTQVGLQARCLDQYLRWAMIRRRLDHKDMGRCISFTILFLTIPVLFDVKIFYFCRL